MEMAAAVIVYVNCLNWDLAVGDLVILHVDEHVGLILVAVPFDLISKRPEMLSGNAAESGLGVRKFYSVNYPVYKG